jgi:hypothetical protein
MVEFEVVVPDEVVVLQASKGNSEKEMVMGLTGFFKLSSRLFLPPFTDSTVEPSKRDGESSVWLKQAFSAAEPGRKFARINDSVAGSV